MKSTVLLVLAAFSGVASFGCSSDPAVSRADVSFPAAALATMQSTSAALTVEVRTAPTQPPGRGLIEVEYTITSTDGTPSDGLVLTVVPWMPDMGHGTSITPSVSAPGGGRYVISDVDLFMPGLWALRTAIAGPSEDSVAPSFQIP
jgi:hypothetical protein